MTRSNGASKSKRQQAILGLVAAAGALWLGTHFTGITIWAMNFALMFALAVGIDYALFIVVRLRAALRAGFTGPWCVEVNTPEFRALPIRLAADQAARAATAVLDAAGARPAR